MVSVMDKKIDIDVTEAYKTLMTDPSAINNMSVDTLRAIASLIREQESLNSNSSNTNQKGVALGLTNPYYKGQDTRTENVFSQRVDGFAGPIILASIALIFGLIFMLIIFNF